MFLILSLVLVIYSLIYYYFRHKFSYWKKRGVETYSARFPFGHLGEYYLNKKSYIEIFTQYYDQSKSEFCGIYQGIDPLLIVKNLEDIKYVLVKNFNCFMNRGIHTDVNNNFLSEHLFRIEDEQWKNLRNKLSPAFTSGKLKAMFETINQCGNGLEYALNKAMDPKTGDINVQMLVQRYTVDVISSVGFGVEANSLKDNYASPIFNLSQDIIVRKSLHSFLIKLAFFGPSYAKILYNFFSEGSEETRQSFLSMVNNIVESREKNKITRKDFLQLLIELKNHGKIDSSNDSLDNADVFDKKDTLNFEFSMKTFVSQVFVFYFAGFDTSALTLTMMLYYLAENQNIQKRLRKEIDECLKKHNNELTYDGVMEMEYLEMVLSETLRLRPVLGHLVRVCNKECYLPSSNLKIDVGTTIGIPIYNIQRDEKYFPNPNKFDPERFSKENISKIPNFAYLPFGDGPRFCIGLRLGKLQTKMGLIAILRNHSVHLSDKTKISNYAPEYVILKPKEHVILSFRKYISTEKE
ncbi:probable cytochrome P450 6a13 [Chrysoperla carnea]|uniref:probable cytochrome P450 6a13 n=1 Tax=Chrysoperla carnea TaxID=189513 RepID=UPI001D066D2C|nr:probable cytochrome P450 6a13 [Chrysoperla carnea]